MAPRRSSHEEDEDIYSDENEDNLIPLNIPPEYQNIEVEKIDMTIRELWDRYANNN